MSRATVALEAGLLVVLSTMAAGGLLALLGWTVLREPTDRRRVGRPEVRTT